jgi:3-oxoacyl-(acyl-carrier-protein) synthase
VGEIANFQAEDFMDARIVGQTDRGTQLALAAVSLALHDAGWPRGDQPYSPPTLDPTKVGVVTASALGGAEFTQREMQNLWGKGPIFVGAYQAVAGFHGASTGQIALKYGLKGYAGVAVAEGAGGLEALAQAKRAISRGMEAMVGGGTEAPLSPFALTCQLRSGNLSLERDPRTAYRPFDARASGYVPGEGGAMLILEELESARRRGAPHIYAEIAGYAATNDAHGWCPEPSGEYLARAISLALERADVTPQDVDLIVADAFGTRERDASEAHAIYTALEERAAQIPVTVPKTMTGRLYAGSAPIDVAAASLALRTGCIPPTINIGRPADEWRLNLVTKAAVQAHIDVVLVLARGFGGFNSALVVKRVE